MSGNAMHGCCCMRVMEGPVNHRCGVLAIFIFLGSSRVRLNNAAPRVFGFRNGEVGGFELVWRQRSGNVKGHGEVMEGLEVSE